MAIVYITGGARSGKSTLAEARARQFDKVLYIATARALDEEMRERVRIHRQRRPASWKTHEGFRELDSAIAGWEGCVLLDCVTNMLTNIMMDMETDWEHSSRESVQQAEDRCCDEMRRLIDQARAQGNELVIVSNELGMGLVPVYAFGRVFRDVAGRVNQLIARLADEAYFCVSGIPVRIK